MQMILADMPLESPLVGLTLGEYAKPALSLPTLADKTTIATRFRHAVGGKVRGKGEGER